MGRKIFGLLSILIILAIVLGACGTETPTTTPSASTSPTTSPAPEAIEIIFADTTPAQALRCQYLKKISEEVETMTGGKVKFTFYWSNSLVAQNELFKAIQTGVADMCYFPMNVDMVPLSWGMVGLPFMGTPTMEVGTEIWWELYNKFPSVQAEWDGVKIMSSSMMPPLQVHTTGKPVRVPGDMRGMKVIGSGEIAKIINAAGATPVEVGVQDLYMSLNSALTEAYINHWPVMNVFGVQPLLPYHANFGEGGIYMTPHAILMNPATFDKLPADFQTIFVEKFKEHEQGIMETDYVEIERCYREADEAGHTTVWLTDEEIQQWADLAEPLYEDWIKRMEGMGKKDARAVHEEAMRLIAAAQ